MKVIGKKNIFSILRSQKGTTLVELVLVIVILGFLAWAFFPKDYGLNPISLDAAARKVKEDIRYAQSLATTAGASYGFQVTGAATYRIYAVATGVAANSPFTNSAMNEDLSIDFGDATFSAQNYQVEFDSVGKPTAGSLTITLVDGDNSKQISISGNSGYITLVQ